MDIQKLIRGFISHYGDLSGQEHLLELFANVVMAEYERVHPVPTIEGVPFEWPKPLTIECEAKNVQQVSEWEMGPDGHQHKVEQPPQTPSPSSGQTALVDQIVQTMNKILE